MKTKLFVVALIAVFSVCLLAETAWTTSYGHGYKKRSYGYYYNYLWIKTYFGLQKLEKKVALLEDSVDALAEGLDQEAMERRAGDEDLQYSIDDEVEARKNADSTLQAKIDEETADREAADVMLQEHLDIETEERVSADMDLQEQIDAIQPGGGAEVPIFFSSGAVEIEPREPGGSDKFWRMGVGYASVDPFYGIIMPVSGTIKGLIAFTEKTPSSDSPEPSFEFTVYKENKPTDVTCNIPAFALNCEDDTNEVGVNRGDRVAIVVFATAEARPSVVGASVILGN